MTSPTSDTGAMTVAPAPRTVWEQSDGLLSGAAIAIRAVCVPVGPEPTEVVPGGAERASSGPAESGPAASDAAVTEERTAVTVTVRARTGQFQVGADGSVTATLLVSPGEALGISAWLREAALAADSSGAPLFDWAPAPDGPDVAGPA
jgi:hypothetical protein